MTAANKEKLLGIPLRGLSPLVAYVYSLGLYHYLGASESGLVLSVVAMAVFVASLSRVGLDQKVIQAGATNNKALKPILSLLVKTTVLGSVFSLALQAINVNLQIHGWWVWLLATPVLVLTLNCSATFSNFCLGKGQYIKSSAFLTAGLYVPGLFLLGVGSLSALAQIALIVMGSLVIGCVAFYSLNRCLVESGYREKKLVQQTRAANFNLFVASIISIFFDQGILALSVLFFDTAISAGYILAYRTAALILLVSSVINSAYTPEIYRSVGSSKSYRQAYMTIVKLNLAFIISGAVFCIVIDLNWLFASFSIEMMSALFWLMFAAGVSALAGPSGVVLIGQNRTKQLMMNQLLSAVIGLVVMAVLNLLMVVSPMVLMASLYCSYLIALQFLNLMSMLCQCQLKNAI